MIPGSDSLIANALSALVLLVGIFGLMLFVVSRRRNPVITVTVKVDTDNAAFADPNELPRIMLEAYIAAGLNVSRLEGRGSSAGMLRDINGNACGSWEVLVS